jgi:undecaprenyl-diphosphatase
MESHLARAEASRGLPRPGRLPAVTWYGLSVSVLALLAFLGIADIVFRQRPLLQVDAIVAEYLVRHATPPTMRIMELFSALAVPGAPLLGIAGALLLVYRRRWADLVLWAAALYGGFLLNWWLKQAYDAIRPAVADPLRLGFEWGFPSGHALAALVVYGAAGVLLWVRLPRPRVRAALVATLAALILLIGFSRLYVRDHYLGDVLAGYAVGLSWLSLCVSAWAAYRRARSA